MISNQRMKIVIVMYKTIYATLDLHDVNDNDNDDVADDVALSWRDLLLEWVTPVSARRDMTGNKCAVDDGDDDAGDEDGIYDVYSSILEI